MAAAPPLSDPALPLIAGRYAVDPARRLAWAGAGIPAFAATDTTTGNAVLALQATPRHPPRAGVLAALTGPIPGLLAPLAHGPGQTPGGEAAYCVICPLPPGPALAAAPLEPWPEAALLDQVLRPAARVLEHLRQRNLTHRAIRLDNVFQRPGQPVTLGAGWAAPPALLQPALFEPPYAALCAPAGRGDGSIADDVYALGVLLVVLALGRLPLAGLPDGAIIQRKVSLGSLAAITGDARLPAGIAELVRGMLAEDPEHRTPPALLLDPAAARSRHVAARPPHRAPRPLTIGEVAASDARTLAYACVTAPVPATRALRSGLLVQWLRSTLGDAPLAARIDELVRSRLPAAAPDSEREDAAMLMRAVALLDPLAPMVWQKLVLWPDGLGSLLAEARGDAALLADIAQLVGAGAVGNWATQRAERCDAPALRAVARQQRVWLLGRRAAGLECLSYALSPLLPCASPLLAGRWVARLADLPVALEAAAARVDRHRLAPVDAAIRAFAAVRGDWPQPAESRPEDAVPGEGDGFGIAQLRLLAGLQAACHPRPLPALAGWVVEQSGPLVARWNNRDRRLAISERLLTLAPSGLLPPMLALLDDPHGLGVDAKGAERAAADCARVDAELAAITAGGPARAATARQLGQELAAGVGLTVLATVLAIAALT